MKDLIEFGNYVISKFELDPGAAVMLVFRMHEGKRQFAPIPLIGSIHTH